MRIETLRDRITNAKAKIEKKQNTIEKKKHQITKKKAEIIKLGYSPEDDKYSHPENRDFYWTMCDIGSLQADIKRNESEIEETKASLKKYEAQLAGEIEKESILLKDVPETMKRMQKELVEQWDEWDITRRNKVIKDHREMDRKAFWNKYDRNDWDLMYTTDEQIHNRNVQDAKELILNLYYRVKDITGEITDWSGIHADIGTWGGTVLNGLVIGKEGRAEVESIYAGGYNIQRLHIRVLVHEIG